MTTQEAYEKIRAWFSRPGAELAKTYEGEEGSTCVYRGGNVASSDLRCAIGCLIPDELYDRRFESRSAATLLDSEGFQSYDLSDHGKEWVSTIALREFFGGTDSLFLSDAQSAHDEATTLTTQAFIRKLDELAAHHGLNVAA